MRGKDFEGLSDEGRIREDWGLGGKDFRGLSEKGYGGLRDEWGGLQMIYGWVGKIREDWGMSRKD